MSQFDKLLQRIKSMDKDLCFDELRKVMEYYGYTIKGPSGGSSHKTFRKPGKQPITIPMHSPVKADYIRLVKDVVESEEKDEDN